MQYRENINHDKLSLLGYGCMRFPKKTGGIDTEETEKLILYAIENGVNYFDTAYIYRGSEEVLGTILAKNKLREKVNVATKLPHYLIKNKEGLDKYFNTQLERLKTNYVDYYLIHMLSDVNSFYRLCDLGIEEWIQKKKESGQIKRIGFSFHGNTDTFTKIIDAYDWEFCMIQYNYMDEHSQAGKRGLQYAAGKNIPVFIMEPLRGGKLTEGLPKKAKEIFEKTDNSKTPAEWAFRWLYNQPEVGLVLSGMNSMETLKENIRIASETIPESLTEQEFGMYAEVKKAIDSNVKVPCTGCGYCMPCPKGVDISGSFRALNVRYSDGYINGLREYLMCTTLKTKHSNASLCMDCGKCEEHCPQSISVRKELKNVVKVLENPIYKFARFFTKRFGRF